ncbi:MAG TPA: hypothetical protein VGD97_11125 [Lacunisphaera sp.]
MKGESRPFGSVLAALLAALALVVPAVASEPVGPADQPVNYEAFGAVGDGVADDLPAIVKAHAFANTHGLPVKTKAGATYHLGRRALTAIIATDTDWGTSRFIIDDTDLENHRLSLFAVKSLLDPVKLAIPRLTRDQRHLDVLPPRDCWVRVENSRRKRYIREGLNQNSGSAQRDCFILRRDGSIEGDIDWDYDTVTEVEAHPIDERPLVLRGGVFTTIANRMKQEKGYNYWLRNIAITRSNTTVVGLTHHITGEGEFGHPYNGFLAAQGCANVTFRDCFVTGHKTYSTIGAAGKPVSMGTYDLIANEVVNFTMSGVRMDNILDSTRWGVAATNFCKNILLENCVLSRMDTHQGVAGTYTIRGCTIGYIGINAIGRGTLLVEDTTSNGRAFISLRSDYGSTWEGPVVIRNCRWIPGGGTPIQPYLLAGSNRGQHDFGYPCFMPKEITIDGLVIDDSQHPKDYAGPYLFNDPDGKEPATANRPFPYQLTEKVTIRRLTTTSGLKIRTSPDAGFAARMKVVEQELSGQESR